MSWAEVSKVNGDFLNAPLDVKMHLADYKMYGEDSYVFQQKELLHGLYECTYLSMNDRELAAEAFGYLLKNNKHIGKAFGDVYGIGRKDTLSTLSTMQAVAASSTAMQAVAASSTAMQAVLASSTAIASICKANYNTTKDFIKAINNKDEYIKQVYDIVTTSANFKNTTNNYADGVANLNQYCNTPETIIFCALGYYGDSRGSTSLFINNEAIKTSMRTGGGSPQSANRNNCNAIAVPNATFSENGDGYAAIAVYKAI